MSISVDDWKKLFSTVPYQWLKAREAAMEVSVTDKEFQTLLLSPQAADEGEQWQKSLDAMKRSNMTELGTAVLEWLPAGATIIARVFPEIKPRGNSFVWTKEGVGPAIFLSLADQTQAQFENTVAHECHHIRSGES